MLVASAVLLIATVFLLAGDHAGFGAALLLTGWDESWWRDVLRLRWLGLFLSWVRPVKVVGFTFLGLGVWYHSMPLHAVLAGCLVVGWVLLAEALGTGPARRRRRKRPPQPAPAPSGPDRPAEDT